MVLIDRNLRGEAAPPLEWDLVAADDLAGGLASTRHLMELGRSRLAFVRGSPTVATMSVLPGSSWRTIGHASAARARPPSFGPWCWNTRKTPQPPRLRRLCDQVLEHQVDGVLCYHDRVAFGLAIELLTRGKAVPGEVAVTGFDDQTVGCEFTLGITSYAYPARAIANEAIALMRGERQSASAVPLKIVVSGRLVVREEQHLDERR